MTEQIPENSENPVQTEVISETQQNKNYLKIVLLVILGLVIVAGAVYVGMQIGKKQTTGGTPKDRTLPKETPQVFVETITLKPTEIPDEIANWKTYTSSMLGFTLKYPAEYNPPEERENYLSLISPLNPNRGKGYELQNGELKIEIVTEEAKENDSSTKCWGDHNSSEAKIINQSEIIINGINTTILNWEGYGTGQFICIIYNEKRYLINKYPLETTRQTEFKQILSTFKFTN